MTVAAAAAFLVSAAAGKTGGPASAGIAKSNHAARTLTATISNFIAGSQSATLEGCRNNGAITFPLAGPFICPDAAYTTGNLGKGWNELDLVPFRLTTTTGRGDATDYNMIIAGDYKLNGVTGWDVVSDPQKGAGSDASCSVSATPATDTTGGDVGPGVTGGADSSIYRLLTIHQNTGTTCVFDYYMRLALGAHIYSGSSLQAYIFSASDFRGGKKTVPLPVNEILPQSLSKDMSASTSQTQAWNISKSPSPATISYGDVCQPGFSNTRPLVVTVSWTKAGITPSGQVHLITHVTATNPASRTITVTPTDEMFEGSSQATQVGSTKVGDPVDVPANTSMTVLTDDQLVSSSATSFNDVATATYIDKATGVAVPGSTQATAAATANTTTLGNSATATDSESITGAGLSFAVATPSFGAFTGSYVAGTYVAPGPVGWSSGTNTITANGQVAFNKTIKLDPAQATSGSITDTATITPSDGGSPVSSAPLTVNISSQSTSTLTINKTIPNVLTGSETAHFVFDLMSGATKVGSASLDFAAGDTSKSVQIAGVAQGSYTVHEEPATGWAPQASDKPVDLTGCSGSVSFTNVFTPATASATKVTDPTGYQNDWTLTLTRPDGTTMPLQTDPAGNVSFGDLAAEGAYTISETPQAGWTEIGAVGGGSGQAAGGATSCSFTVDYVADSGKTYTCTFTNRARGRIIVDKVTNPSGSAQSFNFTTSGAGYSGFSLTDAAQPNDSGELAIGGPYSVAETATPGWTLTSATCDGGNSPASITLLPGQTVHCTFTNTQKAHLIIDKVTNPSGSSQSFGFTSALGNFSLTDAATPKDFTVDPGTYSVSESSTAGWDLTKLVCSDSSSQSGATASVTLSAGQTVTCTFTNTQRGHILVKKVTDPSPDPSNTSFTFTPSYNSGATFTLGNGGTNDSGTLVPGSYSVAEGAVAGWSLNSATCSDGSSVNAISLQAGETVTCTFTNLSRGHVTVVKAINNSPITGSQDFTFELRLGDQHNASTAPLQTKHANLSNGGTIDFDTALIPGNVYAICELLQATYNPTIVGYGPYNPSDQANYWCFNIPASNPQRVLLPSDTIKPIVVNVENDHPVSKGLTIGYWKNWSLCKSSKGGQSDQLGKYLDGITLGTVTFHNAAGSPWECQAIQTLSKNTFTGTNKASDPLFNMAAQLLAAGLNVNAQAGVCSLMLSARSGAQALLVKYAWNGNTYTPALLAVDATAANGYAAQLDKYNNNNLC